MTTRASEPPINARRWNEALRPVTRIAGSDIFLPLLLCSIQEYFNRLSEQHSSHAVLVPNPGGARASRLEPGKACPRRRDWPNDASADRAGGGSREGKLLDRAQNTKGTGSGRHSLHRR